jgi:hypothetical protein
VALHAQLGWVQISVACLSVWSQMRVATICRTRDQFYQIVAEKIRWQFCLPEMPPPAARS